jgi:hypothetical protein
MAKPSILHRRAKSDPISQLFAAMKARRRNLLGIYEFYIEEGKPEPSVQELITATGIYGFTQTETGIKHEDGYAAGQGNFGGMTVPLWNKYKELKTIIFIRHLKGVHPSAVERAVKLTMVHEVQHADDYDAGVIKVGQIDIIDSEYAAHQAALKMARANEDRGDSPMFDMSYLSDPDIQWGQANHREHITVKEMVESAYQGFLGGMKSCWSRLFGLLQDRCPAQKPTRLRTEILYKSFSSVSDPPERMNQSRVLPNPSGSEWPRD